MLEPHAKAIWAGLLRRPSHARPVPTQTTVTPAMDKSIVLKTLTSRSAIVHHEYSLSDIPLKPTEDKGQWTRFVCISDTHCRTFPVPEGDVLLHSGDLTNTGTLDEMEVSFGFSWSE